MNVLDVGFTKINKNEEITNIKKIIGLETNKKYKDKIAVLNGNELALAIKEYEDIEEIMGRLMSFAYLNYAADLSDSENTGFYQNTSETINEISTIMELSVPTIDKHLRLARQNLNAKTTIQAVIKAQKNKQLYNFNYY